MQKDIFHADIDKIIRIAQENAINGKTITVTINGKEKKIESPFPSPNDWRDCWIYMLMIDRFNSKKPPKSTWDKRCDHRQGGTFEGIRQQLDYIKCLGAGAIWISPILKNSRPEHSLEGFKYNYHGYGTQDFLSIDGRFASDGTPETTEKELIQLVQEAHARGLYVILDIVINHAGYVFNYVGNNGEDINIWKNDERDNLSDHNKFPLGSEPSIKWIKGTGKPSSLWQDDAIKHYEAELSEDDAIFPVDLQRKDFFRRRGTTTDGGYSINPNDDNNDFVRGDFSYFRQLVTEYDAEPTDESRRTEDLANLYRQYGKYPVLSILIRIYQYLIAKYDIDGFRIDTTKHVDPKIIQIFSNTIREFSLSIGKSNFFIFGEIADSNEETVASFIGRHSNPTEGFGIDAALDFPLFDKLPGVVKSSIPVSELRYVFEQRKKFEQQLLSSHGEAGRFFVSFIDNHDQKERFYQRRTCEKQLTLALGVLFCLQGIPCLYYGTEQGLQGTQEVGTNGGALEDVREAIWGNPENPFNREHCFYRAVKLLSDLRRSEPALRYGRLYFREVSGNGKDFGHSNDQGGIIAFSRILNESEIVVVANTNYQQSFQDGYVLVSIELNSRSPRKMAIAYSNYGTTATKAVEVKDNDIKFYKDNNYVESLPQSKRVAILAITLQPMEIQIWKSKVND